MSYNCVRRCHFNENTEDMEVPELLWIKHQLDIIDDGGDVLQRSPLEHRNKNNSLAVQLDRSGLDQVSLLNCLKVECS